MTANPLRAARGTTATLNTRVLKDGELAYNTTTDELHVGDGVTLGGRPISNDDDGDDIEVTATGTTTARTLAVRFAEVVNVKDFGAVGDLQVSYGVGAMTSGSPTLTVTGASFTAADVGKVAWVQYAAGGGAPLKTTVAAFVSSTTLTLAANAGATTSTSDVCIGTDDTAAIDAAVASLGAQGGEVFFPAGAYGYSDPDGINLGDGSQSAPSTKQGIALRGEMHGTGKILEGTGVRFQNTLIRYIGSGVGTYMVDAKGPISVHIENLAFDGGYRVTTGWNLKHVFRSHFHGCNIYHMNTTGVRLGAYATATGVFAGASDNIFSQVYVASQGVFGFTAWDIGESAYVAGFDPSTTTWDNCSVLLGDDTTAGSWPTPTSNTSKGFVLRFCDNLRFTNCFVSISGQRRGHGIVIAPPSGSSPAAAFPTEIAFQDCPIIGGVYHDSTGNSWNPSLNSGRGLTFFPLVDGDMSDPGYTGAAALPTSTSLGNKEGISGIASSGVVLDRWQSVQTRAGAISYGVAAVNRDIAFINVQSSTTATDVFSYTVPANQMQVFNRALNANAYLNDRIIRLTAYGSYYNNSGGSVNLTTAVTFGGQSIFTTGAVAVASSAGFRSVRLEIEISESNASSAQQCCYGEMTLGAAFSGSGTAQPAPTVYTQMQTGRTVDITSAQDLKITITHGTSSADVRFRLDSAVVELL